MVKLNPIQVEVWVVPTQSKARSFSKEAFLLVAQQNPFKGPRKPTDGDKKKKKKKGKY